jgi:hypothetical protein
MPLDPWHTTQYFSNGAIPFSATPSKSGGGRCSAYRLASGPGKSQAVNKIEPITIGIIIHLNLILTNSFLKEQAFGLIPEGLERMLKYEFISINLPE